MIDPTTITNYNRTEAELEEFLLFCIMVAGKNAKQTSKKLDSFLFGTLGIISPLDWIQNLVNLEKNGISKNFPLMYCMKQHKLGQYKRLHSAFTGIIQFKNKLKEVSIEQLESIKGIGSKTARFFVLHSRPNQRVAVLDTHILKWMYAQGYDVPRSTPPKGRYAIIEKDFLTECDKAGKTTAEFDLEIWKSFSQK
jgi:thermostable 8-oxoguanine DNA glycosylase